MHHFSWDCYNSRRNRVYVVHCIVSFNHNKLQWENNSFCSVYNKLTASAFKKMYKNDFARKIQRFFPWKINFNLIPNKIFFIFNFNMFRVYCNLHNYDVSRFCSEIMVFEIHLRRDVDTISKRKYWNIANSFLSKR